ESVAEPEGLSIRVREDEDQRPGHGVKDLAQVVLRLHRNQDERQEEKEREIFGHDEEAAAAQQARDDHAGEERDEELRLERRQDALLVGVARGHAQERPPAPDEAERLDHREVLEDPQKRVGDHEVRALLEGHDADHEEKQPHALVTSQETYRRSEEHTSELQSRSDLVCRLLLEKKNRLPRPVNF